MKFIFWLAALLLAATLPATGAVGQRFAVSPPAQSTNQSQSCFAAITTECR